MDEAFSKCPAFYSRRLKRSAFLLDLQSLLNLLKLNLHLSLLNLLLAVDTFVSSQYQRDAKQPETSAVDVHPTK